MDLNFQRSFCYANFPALLCEHFLVQEIILAIVCVYVVIDFALPGQKGAAEFLQIHCPRNSCKNAEIAYIRLAPMEAVQIGMGENVWVVCNGWSPTEAMQIGENWYCRYCVTACLSNSIELKSEETW
jgi:hypothetical protein